MSTWFVGRAPACHIVNEAKSKQSAGFKVQSLLFLLLANVEGVLYEITNIFGSSTTG
jgi:hypothetical protein